MWRYTTLFFYLLLICIHQCSSSTFKQLGKTRSRSTSFKTIEKIHSRVQCAAAVLNNKASFYSFDEKGNCSIYKTLDDAFEPCGEEIETERTVYVQPSGSDISMSEDINLALLKPSQQSGTDREGGSLLAVDGNITAKQGSIPKYYCSHTALTGDLFPWWRLDLVNEFDVWRVILHKAEDNSSLLHDIAVRVGDSNVQELPSGALFHNGSLCGKQTGILPSGPNGITCSKRLSGKYVTIQTVTECKGANCLSRSRNILSLCEVDIIITQPENTNPTEKVSNYYGDNVALNKPAASSTMYNTLSNANSAEPKNAFNNILVSEWGGNNCMQTLQEKWPWLRVNLEDIYTVVRVIIYNLCDTDLVAAKAHDLEIRVGFKDIDNYPKTIPFTANPLCKNTGPVPLRCKFSAHQCSPNVVGQYVSIQIVKDCTDKGGCGGSDPGKNTLHLCEVQVLALLASRANYLYTPDKDYEVLQNDVDNASMSMDLAIPIDASKCTYSSSVGYKLPWWRVDLKRKYAIHKVIIHSLRTSSSLVHDIKVKAGNSDIKDGPLVKGGLCEEITGVLSVQEVVNCDSKVRRYVTIEVTKKCTDTKLCPSPQKAVLSICEVDLIVNKAPILYPKVPWYYLDNVALKRKDVEQSSTNPSGLATNAVDGKFETDWTKLPCTHTVVGPFPWWQVNLDSLYIVYSVIIYNRCDGQTQKRAHDIDIRVGFVNYLSKPKNIRLPFNSLCKNTGATPLTCPSSEHNCTKPLLGQFVSLQIVKDCTFPGGCLDDAQKQLLHVCEVQVMALPWTFQNFRTLPEAQFEVLQSSTRTNYDASLAMDGFMPTILDSLHNDSTCTFSSVYENPEYPWWQVDLSGISEVHKVILYNRDIPLNALLHDVQVTVGLMDTSCSSSNTTFTKNAMCAKQEGILPPGKNIVECTKPVMGRFVTVQIYQPCSGSLCISTTENILSLCEVEVLGRFI